MKPEFRQVSTFPFFRVARYVSLAIIAAGMFGFSFTCEEWRERRNVFVLIIPLGFIVNALSIEIILSKLRKATKAAKPPE